MHGSFSHTADPRTSVVAIGGGHGLARTLEALVELGLHPDAVVTVADDGGSSGKLRSDHKIMALGDMRMALETLARTGPLATVFGHRFSAGQLEGHAVGNLILLALLEQGGGDVGTAVATAGRMLGCAGRVHPCTTSEVTLCARIDGTTVRGQVAIATTVGTIEEVWSDPGDVPAFRGARGAIEAAELILLGPGSLYTSVIPNLLVPEIAVAVEASTAPLVYVGNLTSQPGETAGMDLQAHVEALLRYLPGRRPVTVLAHDGPPAEGSGASLAPVVDHPRVRVVTGDLASRRPDGTVVAAHDSQRLANQLSQILTAARPSTA
ncbi:gluconeogenesis factor YvcK family protein [Euzebya tangerina]|uniref:gluconeogenesis factor YvcK family protein n=1 Tax=Euzebya tangerina TaxID=591198 RepID=UPI0013C2F3B9|nr:gluconeogenesis factor YvcK family protein [Euzebya tangerina]